MCDGATDDTTALTQWAGNIKAETHAIIPGVCVFKSPLTFPSVDHVTMDGGGALTYAGASTTGNQLTFGTPDAVSGCSISAWNISNVRFTSNTVMTAGFGVTFNEICDFEFTGVTAGGLFLAETQTFGTLSTLMAATRCIGAGAASTAKTMASRLTQMRSGTLSLTHICMA